MCLLAKAARICSILALIMSATASVLAQESDKAATSATGAPRFLESNECALCHSHSDFAVAMRDQQDRNVAPFDLWQSSMMANSARDPFWRAAVSAEIAAIPAQKGVIEEVCTRCHAPMATPVPASPDGQSLAFLYQDNQQTALGLDGVSCTVCHQITAANLGTAGSFTGKFEIGREGKIFGPHANPVTMPMQRHVGYTPTESPHVRSSGLCATCHTVITESVDSQGALTHHSFHEQAPYLEWRNSVFNDEVSSPASQAQSCQACHMPTTDEEGNQIATRLAHNPGGRDFPFLRPRSPFGRHTLVGSNAFMTRILRDNAAELGVRAPRSSFDASLEQIERMLQEQTAKLQLGTVQINDQEILIPVMVQNLSGHKLPTAYPSRRVWIQLVVKNQQGNKIFASGEFNSRGELVDANGTRLASELAAGPHLPHFNLISSPADVQVYETVMVDLERQPTYTLLKGASYQKDNRLLPLGWKADHVDGVATQPYGVNEDLDFIGGGDQVQYRIVLTSPGTYTVEATLLYQVLAPRYANEMFEHKTKEVATFKRLYDQADCTPEVLANVTTNVTVGK